MTDAEAIARADHEISWLLSRALEAANGDHDKLRELLAGIVSGLNEAEARARHE